MKETIRDHGHIIFNGNGYSEEWEKEAEKRGLLNLKSTVDALPVMVEPKNIEVFVKHGVYSEVEIRSRYEILLENYSKVINIEALTAADMVRKNYLPAISEYVGPLCDAVLAKKAVGLEDQITPEAETLKKLSAAQTNAYRLVGELEGEEAAAADIADGYKQARAYHDKVLPKMEALRAAVDTAEVLTGEDYWPVPSYTDLLFRV